jgi:C-terminal, D2-small domain, of ClpB protein
MQKGVSAFCGIRQIRLNNVGSTKETIDQKYGACPLKRAQQKYVEDPLAEEMLKGRFSEGSIIRIAFDEAENELRFVDGVVPVPEGEGQAHSE